MRYIVQGTDAVTGRSVRRTIEAGSAGEAEIIAQEEGLSVRSISLDDGAADAPEARPAADDDRRGGVHRNPRNEKAIWEGGPSQWSNVGWFAACALILPIPVALYKYLATRSVSIRVTSQRLQIETGILSRALEEIELYRVKDTTLERSFLQRLVGLGTVRIITSDESAPLVLLKHLRDAKGVRETIRAQVEAVRRARGVREFDVS